MYSFDTKISVKAKTKNC